MVYISVCDDRPAREGVTVHVIIGPMPAETAGKPRTTPEGLVFEGVLYRLSILYQTFYTYDRPVYDQVFYYVLLINSTTGHLFSVHHFLTSIRLWPVPFMVSIPMHNIIN